jgi:CheY-like chemotaxis protein
MLTISTMNAELREDDVRAFPDAAPGRYVSVRVDDTGCGIDEETRSHIFEPFFSTKSAAGGSGLGLSTVYGIVTQSHGVVRVESEKGRGSTFEVLLAASASAAGLSAGRTGEPSESEPLRGLGTVLLVEDEQVLRETLDLELQELGYHVLAAANAEEAMGIAEEAGEIDILVTDIVLPGARGMELADRLRALLPELKTLLISGYAAEGNTYSTERLAGWRVLRKPFSIADLAGALRAVSDSTFSLP